MSSLASKRRYATAYTKGESLLLGPHAEVLSALSRSHPWRHASLARVHLHLFPAADGVLALGAADRDRDHPDCVTVRYDHQAALRRGGRATLCAGVELLTLQTTARTFCWLGRSERALLPVRRRAPSYSGLDRAPRRHRFANIAHRVRAHHHAVHHLPSRATARLHVRSRRRPRKVGGRRRS